MTSHMISLKTIDGAKINGILYSESKKDKVVVLIHGACMNFLEGMSYFIPQNTSSYNEYDFFSVNMRAHDLGYIVNNYNQKEGWAWQTIEKNRLDMDAICAYLSKEKYTNITFCCHSWGGLVCLDYLNHSNKDDYNNIILLSPTVSFNLLAKVNYKNSISEILEQAKQMISAGLENSIIPTEKDSPIPFMSAKTVYEFITCEFEANSFLQNIRNKVNIFVGGLEHKKLQEFSSKLAENNKFIQSHIIKKSNHFYIGHENEVVNTIDLILGGHDYE